MNVLGIIGFGQNPSAALLMNGKLVAFAEEERFTRLKGSDDMFPAKAISYCLAEGKLSLEGVNRIAFGWDAPKYPWRMTRTFASSFLKYRGMEKAAFHHQKDSSSKLTALTEVMAYHPDVIRSKIQQGLRAAGLAGAFPKIDFVQHHLAHAYSTYFCSPFERAGILTIDGSGEDVSTQIAIGEGNQVRVLESVPLPHSLGWFYAAITEYLGFVPYRDEGKVMGLAALGEERKDSNRWLEPLSKVLKIQDGAYEVDPTYTKFGGHYYGSRFTDALVRLLTDVDAEAPPITYGEKASTPSGIVSKYLLPRYVDLAWAAQELLERAAVGLAAKLVKDHKLENLCVAGGVAMNCKMNGEILRRSGCKNIFVQPASSDAGTALGAAMAVALEHGDPVRNPLKNCYYGPGFTNDQIRKDLNNLKIPYAETDRPSEVAADMLADGKMVAWFQGRMEFGARALGGRSILANPLYPNIKEKVNAEVKYRENWRPFCPSMLADVKDKYLKDANEASFMIVAYPIQEAMRDKVPGIVHVDGTVRPQAVTREASPRFYELIEEVGKRTGHPVVLNTSFNVRSEPIICTPLEAVRCFYSNGLDALVMGNFVLKKQS